MRRFVVLTVLALVVIAGGLAAPPAGAASRHRMPNVVGLRLDRAIDKLKDSGFKDLKWVDRGGHRHIVLKRNWWVQDQTPKARSKRSTSTKVVLGIDRSKPKVKKKSNAKAVTVDGPTPPWTKKWSETTCGDWRNEVPFKAKFLGADGLLTAFRNVDHLGAEPGLAIPFAEGITNVCSALPDSDGSSIANLAILLYKTDGAEDHPQGFRR